MRDRLIERAIGHNPAFAESLWFAKLCHSRAETCVEWLSCDDPWDEIELDT